MQDVVGQPLEASRGILAGSRLVSLILYVNDLAASKSFYGDTLGLRLIEEDDDSAKYDTGQTLLCLNRASDHGVTLASPDHSADMTFLVDDLDGVRDELERAGVEFSETLRYEIGATVNFYDPDGHWLSLYEPSKMAMTWPSGDKIRAILKAGGNGAASQGSNGDPLAASSGGDARGPRLGGRELIYLFLFVPDADLAFDFYHTVLGLNYMECRPCRRGSTGNERGVVKYDGGGLMLTTHHFDGACPATSAPRQLTTAQMKGIAPVFHVTDLDQQIENLAQAAIPSGAVSRTEAGSMASFEDPFGRAFYLYEPSKDTLGTPTGAKISEIMVARL